MYAELSHLFWVTCSYGHADQRCLIILQSLIEITIPHDDKNIHTKPRRPIPVSQRSEKHLQICCKGCRVMTVWLWYSPGEMLQILRIFRTYELCFESWEYCCNCLRIIWVLKDKIRIYLVHPMLRNMEIQQQACLYGTVDNVIIRQGIISVLEYLCRRYNLDWHAAAVSRLHPQRPPPIVHRDWPLRNCTLPESD